MSAFNNLVKSLDHEDMIGFVRKFPEDCAASFNRIDDVHHPWIEEISRVDWSGWLCLGMGGSAAGGSFVSDLANYGGNKSVHVHRDYKLPSWWSTDTLIIATSYSGNTEETIAAVEEAISRGGTIVAICSGGQLAGLSELHENVHLVLVPSGQPPRSAFGHIFGSQISLAWALGLLERPSDEELVRMIERMKNHVASSDFVNNTSEIAELAAELTELPIAIVAPTEFTGVAERMRNQMNENAARFARVAIIPEMNHNEIVAWGDKDDFDSSSNEQGLILLTWNGIHGRNSQRMTWLIEHLRTSTAWKISCEGETLLEAMLHACIDMDWLSCALALLHGKDPSSIGPIRNLKGHLESIK